MLSSIFQILLVGLALVSGTAWAQSYTGPEDPRVKVELVLEHPVNGVSITPDDRIFLVYQRIDGSEGPQLVEYFPATKTQNSYPNIE